MRECLAAADRPTRAGFQEVNLFKVVGRTYFNSSAPCLPDPAASAVTNEFLAFKVAIEREIAAGRDLSGLCFLNSCGESFPGRYPCFVSGPIPHSAHMVLNSRA